MPFNAAEVARDAALRLASRRGASSTRHFEPSAPSWPQHRNRGDPLFADGRNLVGRTDVSWTKRRLLGEFDGRDKYLKYLTPGQRPSDVLFAEKAQEHRLRREGFGMVRWTWADLVRPGELVNYIRESLELTTR